jgi:hypothetical protein
VADDLVFEIEDSLTTPSALGRLRRTEDGSYKLPDEWNVRATQLSTLFDLIHSSKWAVRPKLHQYGLTWVPFRQPETFDEISSVLTLSSRSPLDLPEIHEVAKETLSSFFPHVPTPYYKFGQSEEALVLAIEHDVKPVRDSTPCSGTSGFLHHLSTIRHDIDPEDVMLCIDCPHRHRCERRPGSHRDPPNPLLHPAIIRAAQHLQSQLISHFTPILFTVSTAGHMACTDAFADHWMTSVISPALSDPTGGVNAPIETLEKLCELDWVGLGICEECVRDKREEWKGEVDTIWEKMDEWLSIP